MKKRSNNRSVVTQCSEYVANVEIWKKCRDVVAGEKNVKKSGEKYLPKAEGMSTSDYMAYKQRAEFFNATGRTLDGLHGMMFRINPFIECDKGFEQYLENVDKKNSSFVQFLSDCAYSILQVGFGGVLVDAPQGADRLSVREAEDKKEYPYLAYYKAEDIINWRYTTCGRGEKLSLVVLRETVDVDTEDEFLQKKETLYRVLDLHDGIYRQRLLRENGTAILEDALPRKFGELLDYIPFYFLPSKVPEKPILLDLVDVNLSWYRKSADYESGLHYTSVPTPYTVGWTPEEVGYDELGNPVEKEAEKIKLSSSSFIHFPDAVRTVGMLEFTGSGLGSIATAMEKDEERMAILGARIISAEKRGIEAAETAKIHRAGENSVLAAFANNLSIIFTRVLTDYLEWIVAREVGDVHVSINTDYDVVGMTAAELTAYVSAWQQGAISRRVMFHNIKKGEAIPDGMSFEDMMSDIEEDG